MFVRILIWNLFESKTTLDELREHLPGMDEDAFWFSNEGQDRFGIVSIGEAPPDLGALPELIGAEPTVVEEFDVLE